MAKTSRTQRRFASTTSAREEAREETDCTDWCRSPPVLYASSSPSIASTTGANAAATARALACAGETAAAASASGGGAAEASVFPHGGVVRGPRLGERVVRARVVPEAHGSFPLRDERGGRARASAAFSRRRGQTRIRVFLRHPSGARERRGQRVRAEHRGIDPRDALRGPRVDGEPLAVQARAQLDPRGDRLRERGGGGRDEERQARRRRRRRSRSGARRAMRRSARSARMSAGTTRHPRGSGGGAPSASSRAAGRRAPFRRRRTTGTAPSASSARGGVRRGASWQRRPRCRTSPR